MPYESMSPEERAAAEQAATRVKYIGTQLALSLLGAIAKIGFGTSQVGRNIDLALVGMAVFVSEQEGRPLTIHKASLITGMPRATVQRKIEALTRLGYLERDGSLLRIGPKWRAAVLSLESSRLMYNLIVSAYGSSQAIDPKALDLIHPTSGRP